MTLEPDGSDESLAERARDGDEEAFRVLLERHAKLLEGRIRKQLPRYLSRRISISDVLQETRLTAFERREYFDRDRGPFRNWILGIADRKVAEARRRHERTGKRRAAREITRGNRPDTANFPGKGPTPSEAAIGAETAELARRALQALSPDYREVLRLSQEYDLGLDEVAERMGRSREAAKKLYGRAVVRFRSLLDELRHESHE